jgi:Cytochrome c
VTSNSAAALALTGLVLGCTGILYGSDEAAPHDEVIAHGAAQEGGRSSALTPDPMTSGAPAAASAGAGGEHNSVGGVDSTGGAMPEAAGGSSCAGDAGGGDGGQPPSGSEGGAGGRPSEGGHAGVSAGGDDGSAGSSGSGGSGGEPELVPGDKARGYQLVIGNNCYRCHGSDLSGQGFYRNITPDLGTGVGTWTDPQLALAIVGGINREGELLCASMPVYSGLTEQGVLDMVAFLRSIPPKKNQITQVCAGHDP